MRFFLFLSCVGSVIGGVVLIGGVATSQGAPQQAAAAAIAMALAVIPYVFARCIYMWRVADAGNIRHRELLDALAKVSATQGYERPATLQSPVPR